MIQPHTQTVLCRSTSASPRHTGVTENNWCSPRLGQCSKPKACITMPDNHSWPATDAAPCFKIDSLSNLKPDPSFKPNSLSLILENRWLWLASRLHLSRKMCTQLCANSVCDTHNSVTCCEHKNTKQKIKKLLHCLGYEIVSNYKSNLIWKGKKSYFKTL